MNIIIQIQGIKNCNDLFIGTFVSESCRPFFKDVFCVEHNTISKLYELRFQLVNE